MTESEAIKVLNMIETHGALPTMAKAKSIEALEKQIPKKPDCIEDKMWCCPVCDNHLLPKWIKYPTELMPKSEGLPYCMSCGQAIDWGDEEHGKNGT